MVNMIGIKADFGRKLYGIFIDSQFLKLFKDSKIKNELDFYKQSHLV